MQLDEFGCKRVELLTWRGFNMPWDSKKLEQSEISGTIGCYSRTYCHSRDLLRDNHWERTRERLWARRFAYASVPKERVNTGQRSLRVIILNWRSFRCTSWLQNHFISRFFSLQKELTSLRKNRWVPSRRVAVFTSLNASDFASLVKSKSPSWRGNKQNQISGYSCSLEEI